MTLDLKDRLYTSSEVAEILGVSLRSVYRYLEEDKLDADIKTATGRHRFSKKNILDFLQPGGISRDHAEDKPAVSEDEDLDVLDLPAINKSKNTLEKDSDLDDFSFDLDEDFFKSLNLDSNEGVKTQDEQTNPNKNQIQNGEFVDDDLEKLLKEFEEKEGLNQEEGAKEQKEIKAEASFKDDFDFDLDSFFKELEESPKNESFINTPAEKNMTDKDEFDFDFDKIEEFLQEEKDTKVHDEPVISKQAQDAKEADDSEDNWLERFRKAAMSNSAPSEKTSEPDDKLKSSFFDKSNLDQFFDGTSETKKSGFESISSISFKSQPDSEIKTSKTKEYFYTSSLNGLKEIAQNIDKIAKKFDTDYAFTMNAGLSLHKPIAPFTIIHTYIRGRDLELFEDYLNLSAVESPSEASVCLMVAEELNIFEDAYELHGLYVVSNVQLRSDLIDNGLDKLAREI